MGWQKAPSDMDEDEERNGGSFAELFFRFRWTIFGNIQIMVISVI